MNGMEMLIQRRSIRRYRTDPVPKEQVEQLLKAAFYAPSAKNQHPLHYIVVDQKETLLSFQSFHQSAAMFEKAPMAIIVCGDAAQCWATWRDDAAAATTNICNAAYELGLGTCWCGLYPRDVRVDGMKKAMKLPGNIMPYSLIAVGYPDQETVTPVRDYSHMVHYNQW